MRQLSGCFNTKLGALERRYSYWVQNRSRPLVVSNPSIPWIVKKALTKPVKGQVGMGWGDENEQAVVGEGDMEGLELSH